MYATDSILTLAFPFGRLGGTRLRLSFFFPVLAVALMWRLESIEFALLASAILLFSVLVHELTHLLVARSCGSDMDEIRLWPLGGLSEPYGRGFFHDHVKTMMAGPVVNLVLALSCLLTLTSQQVTPLLNPFAEFSLLKGEPLAVTAWRIAFVANWTLFLANLIPITPFDGGVLLRTYLTTRFTESESRDLIIRLGLLGGLFGILFGFIFDLSGLVTVSAFVLILLIHENLRWFEFSRPIDDSAEYDFDDSEAEKFSESWFDTGEYPANEQSNDAEILDRWRDQREHERLQQEQEERQREEQQVDEILQKLHQNGRESLSNTELHLLNRVSDRYRNGKQHN